MIWDNLGASLSVATMVGIALLIVAGSLWASQSGDIGRGHKAKHRAPVEPMKLPELPINARVILAGFALSIAMYTRRVKDEINV